MRKKVRSVCGIILVTVLCEMAWGAQEPNAKVLSDANMRFVRLRATILNGMGEPVQNVEWNTKGEFRKVTTESRWVPIRRSGESDLMMMFQDLLIPGAPWMRWKGVIYAAADEGAEVEIVGNEDYHPLKLPGQAKIDLRMWFSTYTDGKWVGVLDDKIYQCGTDGAGEQIGWLTHRNLTIETGETVILFMTKGMEAGAKWEGDAGDTAYREDQQGTGTPIAKLEFRRVKLDDGKLSVILMSRPLIGGATWTGVSDGKILESR